MTERAGFTKDEQQARGQRRRKPYNTGKQSDSSNSASNVSGASSEASSCVEKPRGFSISSHPIWGDQAAVAQAKLGPAYPWFQPSQPIHQVPEYVQLNYQLLVAQAEQQRVQKDLDTMTKRNTALTSRCSQLERQLQASQAAERSSSAAAAAAADKQLEGMRQQLDEANRFLAQQQKANQQQAQQLQLALGELAAEREKAAQATAAAESFEQELKQIKAQLVASQDQEGVLLAGVQRPTTAGTQKQAALAAAEGQVAALVAEGNNLQQQLAALQQEHQQLQQQYKEMQETNVNVTRALLLLTEQQEEAVTTVQQLQGEVQQLKRQLTAATAAKQSALRDAAATLSAMTHFDGQLAEGQREIQDLNKQLAAAKAESKRLNGLLGEAHEQIAAMPGDVEQLKRQVVQLVQQAEAAETLVTITKINCRHECDLKQQDNEILKAEKQQAYDALKAEKQQAYDALKAEKQLVEQCLVNACSCKHELMDEVARLRRVVQSVPEAQQLLKALGARKAVEDVLEGRRKGGCGWLWNWVVRRQGAQAQAMIARQIAGATTQGGRAKASFVAAN